MSSALSSGMSTRMSPTVPLAHPAPDASFHADSGIASISRLAVPSVSLPAQADLQPSALTEQVQLDRLFALRTLDDFIHRQLIPDLHDLALLSPTRFRMTLGSTRRTVLEQAAQQRDLARKLGKLAAVLDEQDELVRLAQLYCAALVQG